MQFASYFRMRASYADRQMDLGHPSILCGIPGLRGVEADMIGHGVFRTLQYLQSTRFERKGNHLSRLKKNRWYRGR